MKIIVTIFHKINFLILLGFVVISCNQAKEKKSDLLSPKGQKLYEKIQPLIYSNQEESLALAEEMKSLTGDSITQILGEYYLLTNRYLSSTTDENLNKILAIYDTLKTYQLYDFLFDIDVTSFEHYYGKYEYESAASRIDSASKYIFEPNLEAKKTAIIYGLTQEEAEAVDKNLAILEINKTIKSIEDKSWSLVHNELYAALGRIYDSQGEYEKALETFLKIANQSIENGFHVQAAYAYGIISYIHKDYDKGLDYVKKAISIMEKAGYNSFLDSHWKMSGHNYSNKLEYKNAFNSYHKAIHYAEINENKASLANNYAYAGWAYYNIDHANNGDQCENYLKKSIEISEQKGIPYIIGMERLLWFYTSTGDQKEENLTKKAINQYEEELRGLSTQLSGRLIKNKLYLQAKEEQINNLNSAEELNEQRLETQKFLSYISIFLGITTLWLLVLFNQRNRLLKENKKRQKQMFSINTNLKNKNSLIENQNEELKKNRVIIKEELKSKINLLSKNVQIFEQLNKEIETASIDRKSKISLLHLIDEDYNKKVIDDIEQQFSIVNEEFIEKLMTLHPDLTSNNVKLCVYIKSGLSNREIAAMNFTAESSVKIAKTRLKKRLGIANETPLGTYLKSL